jgi:acetate kinase
MDRQRAATLIRNNSQISDATSLAELVNDRSGLLGVSGITSEMKTLLERRGSEPDAPLAVEMFSFPARQRLGALSAGLGGLDFYQRR